MLFQWTANEYGKIWLDCEAFRQICANRITKGLVCQNVSFDGEHASLDIFIAAPDDMPSETKEHTASDLSRIFCPAGISARVHWATLTPTEVSAGSSILHSSWFWAAAAGGLTAVLFLGLTGSLYTLAAAAVGWAVSTLVISGAAKEAWQKIQKNIKR